MALSFSKSAPAGFMVDEQGKFVKVDQKTYDAAASGQPSGRSLEGTMTAERTLPADGSGGLTSFKNILRTTALSARAANPPPADTAPTNNYPP